MPRLKGLQAGASRIKFLFAALPLGAEIKPETTELRFALPCVRPSLDFVGIACHNIRHNHLAAGPARNRGKKMDWLYPATFPSSCASQSEITIVLYSQGFSQLKK